VSGFGVREKLRMFRRSHEIGREDCLRKSRGASWCSKNFQFVYFIVEVKKVSDYSISSSDGGGSRIYVKFPTLEKTSLLVRGS
jgi:hypothetical protein